MKRRSLSEPLRRALRQASSEMHVALPAQIERYDHTEQRADVLPLLRRAYVDGEVQDMPVVPDVPVVWPRSGGAQMTMPVRRGDTVLLVFTDRSIDRWLAQGGNVTPDDRRQHDLSDAVAVPGLVPFADFGDVEPSENNDDVLVRYDGSQVRLKPNGAVEVETASTVVVSTGQVTINAPVQINGDVTVDGDVVASGVSLVSHTHGGVVQGDDDTEPPN